MDNENCLAVHEFQVFSQSVLNKDLKRSKFANQYKMYYDEAPSAVNKSKVFASFTSGHNKFLFKLFM